MTVTTLLSGDLIGMLQFARGNSLLCTYIVVYTFIAYVAISIHMNVVRRFGGVAAVLLATVRKGMTLILSFILFPKAFSWYYVWGAFLVLGGLLFSSLHNIHQKNSTKKKRDLQLQHKSTDIDDNDDDGVNMTSLGKTTTALLSSSSSETKRLLGNNIDEVNGGGDIEQHNGIHNGGTGKNSTDAMTVSSTLELTKDRLYEQNHSVSIATSEGGGSSFFGVGRSPSHDHQL
jgi:hypothetical protein